MSKRAVIWTLLGLLIVAGLVLSNFGRNLPAFFDRDPVFTEVIPSKRPPRLDRRLIGKFAGVKVDQIISTLKAERSADPESAPLPASQSKGELLLASLPDAPLPFSDEAPSADPDWLREFVTRIQNGTTGTPSDDEIWQFNLALSALDIDTSQIPESLRRNISPRRESDTFDVKLTNKSSELKAPYCTGDFNGDGVIEFVGTGGSNAFHLDDSGNLAAIQWPAIAHPGDGLFPADYDNDGDLDLFITRGDGMPNTLLRNRGDGRFDDVTSELGLLSFDSTNLAIWLDYDQDGHLDLLTASEDHPLELYRQNNLAAFEPVAWDVKLWIPRGTRHVEVVDFNSDQYPDFYIGIEGLPDRLYQGQPSGDPKEWRFKDIAPTIALPQSPTAAPALFFDFDNDAKLDLVSGAGGVTQIFYNEGDGNFTNVSADIQLPEARPTAFGAFDIDNDGFEDLLIGTAALQTNHILWNQEGTDFRDVSITSRGSYLDEPVSIEASDLDANGHADVIYTETNGNVRWLETSGPVGRWVHVDVKGALPIGSQVTAIPRDDDWIIQKIPRTLSKNHKLTIGLGDATIIETLAVTLPDGSQAVAPLNGLQPDQRVVIEIP